MADAALLLSRRHPEYDKMNPRWTFWLESYNGGEDYINETNLFKYFKEGSSEYSQRKLRAYRENHSRWCIDLINTYLHKSGVVRKTGNALLQEFFDNFDGNGLGIDACMKVNSQHASALGRVYIIVDKHLLSDEKKTGTQADNIQNMPYAYRVKPQDVLDLAFDGHGDITWALIREERRDDADPFTSTGDVREYYKLWERGRWTLFDDAGREVGSGETGIDVVPMVILDNETKTRYAGQSMISDIAPLDRAICNNWSRLDTIVNDQAFSQLIYPIEALPPEIIEDEGLRGKFITMATSRVLFYNAAAGVAPQFIAPDAAQAEFILKMIQAQTKQLYAMLGLQSETATETKAQSGVAKAYDFDKINRLLTSKAQNLEEAEWDIVRIWCKWMGLDILDDVELAYPDEFDVRGLAEELTEAERLQEMNISPTFTKEILKNVVAKALPKADDEVIQEIFGEIDDMTSPEAEAVKQPRFEFDGFPPLPSPKQTQ